MAPTNTGAPDLALGAEYSSLSLALKAIKKYEALNKVSFWRRDSKTLANAKKRGVEVEPNPAILYYWLNFTCVSGGRNYTSKSSGMRPNCSTSRQGCGACVMLRASRDSARLVVTKMNERHNHGDGNLSTVSILKEEKLSEDMKNLLEKSKNRLLKQQLSQTYDLFVRQQSLPHIEDFQHCYNYPGVPPPTKLEHGSMAARKVPLQFEEDKKIRNKKLKMLWRKLQSIAAELSHVTGVGVLVATRLPPNSNTADSEMYLNYLPRNCDTSQAVRVHPNDCARCYQCSTFVTKEDRNGILPGNQQDTTAKQSLRRKSAAARGKRKSAEPSRVELPLNTLKKRRGRPPGSTNRSGKSVSLPLSAPMPEIKTEDVDEDCVGRGKAGVLVFVQPQFHPGAGGRQEVENIEETVEEEEEVLSLKSEEEEVEEDDYVDEDDDDEEEAEIRVMEQETMELLGWKCSVCHVPLDLPSRLRQHMVERHPGPALAAFDARIAAESRIQCRECGEGQISGQGLEDHWRERHQMAAARSSQPSGHGDMVHSQAGGAEEEAAGSTSQLCHHCGVRGGQYSGRGELDQHLILHTVRETLCRLCGEILTSVWAAAVHTARLHKKYDDAVVCRFCARILPTCAERVDHEAREHTTSTPEDSVECEEVVEEAVEEGGCYVTVLPHMFTTTEDSLVEVMEQEERDCRGDGYILF